MISELQIGMLVWIRDLDQLGVLYKIERVDGIKIISRVNGMKSVYYVYHCALDRREVCREFSELCAIAQLSVEEMLTHPNPIVHALAKQTGC